VNVSAPVAAPVAMGVKVTPTVHVVPAAMLAPHVLLASANAPPAATLLKVTATLA
jgi:hypothetical protein